MTDDFTLDPARTYNPKKPVVAQPVALQPSSFIPDMDDAQLRKLTREKLSRALQAISPEEQPEMTRKLCAEVMDRIDGKPAQAVTVDQTVKHITVKATIRFAEMPVRVDNYMQGPVDNVQVIDNEG